MIKAIGIDLGEPKTEEDVAIALQEIAKQINNGSYSGIVGWSDVSWAMEEQED